MPRRFVLAPVVGAGTITDPYRAKTQDYGVRGSAVIPSDPATGAPLFPWCLVVVAGNDLTGVLGDSAIEALPDLTLDSKLSTLTTAQRNRLLTALSNRGVSTSGLTTQSTLRDVLRRVGTHLTPGYREDAHDVGLG